MKIVAFDLDDVLCSRNIEHEEKGPDKYKYCYPIINNIKIMNECYDKGYYIKIYTARGMTQFSGDYNKIIEHLYGITYNQLVEWGAKFHELIFGKTHYDLLIDDKVRNIADIKSINDIQAALNEI